MTRRETANPSGAAIRPGDASRGRGRAHRHGSAALAARRLQRARKLGNARLGLAGFVLLLAAATSASVLSGCSFRRQKLNVVLVTIDTIRADRVGCYGDTGAHTPNLDRVAREGFLFSDAVTAVPLTLPSHTTIMTGCFPARHGVRNNGMYHVPPETMTLARRFQDAGYRTGAFVSAFVLQRQFGLDRGFEVYDDSLFNERPGYKTVQKAVAWLASKDRRPFFLWMHLYDPHTPWTPPPPYSTLPLRSGYEREIAAADGALGTLLDYLKSSGNLNHTIVTVIGDHGEGLNDHGEAEHGIFIYNETVRIPWLLRLPGGTPAGQRVPNLVGTVDVAPTLLALAGLPPLTVADGMSVVPALHGQALPERHGLPLETMYPQQDFGWAPLLGWDTPTWKWIRAPESELYDLKGDPGERNNLRSTDPDTAALLDRRLERTLTAIEPAAGAEAKTLSKEVTERLRSLGYVSAGALAPQSSENLPDPKTMISSHADFEQAKKAVDDQRYSDAIPYFRKVLARQDRNLVALLGLALSLNRTGDYEGAEDVSRKAVSMSPGNTTAIQSLADAAFGQERWQDSMELYQLAARDQAAARSCQGRIALCQAKLGRMNDALATLGAIANTPGEGNFANLSRHLQEYETADASARNLRDRTARDTTEVRIARLAAGLGFVRESERILKAPLPEPEVEEQRLQLLAELEQELGQPAEALDAIRRLEKSAGTSTALQEREADLLAAAGHASEALEAYDRLPRDELARTGQLGEVSYNRACILARLGRKEEALAAIHDAVHAGFHDLSLILNDVDLAGLREEPRFTAIVDSLSESAPAPQ